MQTVLTLDELELPLIRRDTLAPLADVVLSAPASVHVDYDYEPGQHEILRPDPNDSQPGYPDSVRVWEVTAAELMKFDNEGISILLEPGFDLTHLLRSTTTDALESEILASIRSHRRAA
jgi:hypothetical protein